MAVQKSLGQFSVEMAFLASDMPRMTREATEASALMVTRTIRASIASDSGGDSKLSGANARVGARYDVKGVVNPVALIKAIGPVHWLESGTSAHAITAKIGRAAGRSRAARRAARQATFDALFGGMWGGAKPLRTPYGPRMRVLHPGTSGKQTWSRPLNAVLPRVPEVYAKGLRDAVRRAIS